jgi:MraZ protein
VFRGTSHLTLDSKGRLVIPTRHRDALLACCGGHLVITLDPDQCLAMYPLPEWELVQQKFEVVANIDPRVREMQRQFIGLAQDTDMDAAGRVLLSPELRQHAHLEKDVALVGQIRKFEIWDRTRWADKIAAATPLTPENIPPQLEGFSY